MITELCYKSQTKQTKNMLTNMLYQIWREENYHHLKPSSSLDWILISLSLPHEYRRGQEYIYPVEINIHRKNYIVFFWNMRLNQTKWEEIKVNTTPKQTKWPAIHCWTNQKISFPSGLCEADMSYYLLTYLLIHTEKNVSSTRSRKHILQDIMQFWSSSPEHRF